MGLAVAKMKHGQHVRESLFVNNWVKIQIFDTNLMRVKKNSSRIGTRNLMQNVKIRAKLFQLGHFTSLVMVWESSCSSCLTNSDESGQ